MTCPRRSSRPGGRGYTSFNIKVAPEPDFDLDLCRPVHALAPDLVALIGTPPDPGPDTGVTGAIGRPPRDCPGVEPPVELRPFFGA
jgi:hypothetical protein